ncbi:ABC transporter transmembrane domain-containing protein, partial [Planctomycetota bacterium]
MHYLWDQDDDEDAARGSTRGFFAMLSRLLPLFRPHLAIVVGALVLLLTATVADVAGPLVLRHLIDVDIASGSRAGIVGSAALFMVLFLIARGAAYLQVVIVARMGLEVVTGLKRQLFDHLMSLSMAFFDKHPPGRLLSRVESDTERMLILFTQVGLALFGSLVVMAATFAVMLVADWRITLGVLILLGPLSVLNIYVLRYLRRFYSRGRKAYAEVTSFLTEHLQAVPVIQ